MASPNSSSLTQVVENGLGEVATLALQPEGFSGISNESDPGFTQTLAVASTGQAIMSAQFVSGGIAEVITDATVPSVRASVVNSGGAVTGVLSVAGQQVTAGTNPATPGNVNVTHDVGLITTLTADAGHSGSTTFVNQTSNRKSEFYGVGVLNDSQSSGQQDVAAICTVPFSHTLGGTNIVLCELQILMVAKCTATDSSTTPAAGDYLIQRGYSMWRNNAGVISAMNLSIDGGGNTVINPFYIAVYERGTPFGSPGFEIYSIALTTIVAAGSESLVVKAAPTFHPATWGTTVVELFVTAYFN